ncbi:YkyA family protein [Texcoconibacillus texcoconensis]|uniref:Chromosome segregation ATPase n=1 Tax=Texcoconibacillus texcoconensis TaxID=1095777 RepID=A0A840QLJ6_9BACI|nr:YkyA family protein [Texcoconibacillus texcoconensis]MBB5172242.1 chromosome segregation ATPase [Texcoconibacillus texcoconensis]
MKANKKIYGIVATAFLFTLTGCGNDPTESMYEHLEETVSLEAEFAEQQQPLAEAEQHEQELYEEMLELPTIEEIEPIADEAISSSEERLTMLETERESLEGAFEQFQEAETYVEQMDEEDLLEQADVLIHAMEERFSAYDDLYEVYKDSIELDQQLYEMIQEEELTVEELQDHHEKVNEAYEEVNELKDQFNEYTDQYNEAKESFYEKAGLAVTYTS